MGWQKSLQGTKWEKAQNGKDGRTSVWHNNVKAERTKKYKGPTVGSINKWGSQNKNSKKLQKHLRPKLYVKKIQCIFYLSPTPTTNNTNLLDHLTCREEE